MFRQRDIVEVEVGIIHGQKGMLGRAQDHRGERTVRAEPSGRSPLQEQEEEEGSVKKRQSSELRGELGRHSLRHQRVSRKEGSFISIKCGRRSAGKGMDGPRRQRGVDGGAASGEG